MVVVAAAAAVRSRGPFHAPAALYPMNTARLEAEGGLQARSLFPRFWAGVITITPVRRAVCPLEGAEGGQAEILGTTYIGASPTGGESCRPGTRGTGILVGEEEGSEGGGD